MRRRAAGFHKHGRWLFGEPQVQPRDRTPRRDARTRRRDYGRALQRRVDDDELRLRLAGSRLRVSFPMGPGPGVLTRAHTCRDAARRGAGGPAVPGLPQARASRARFQDHRRV